MKNILYVVSLCLGYFQVGAQQTALPYGGRTPDSTVTIKALLPGFPEAQTITVAVVDGMAIYQGDIDLGPIGDLLNVSEERGIVIDGDNYRWPDGVIPYSIDAGFSATYLSLIDMAVEYINGSTHARLIPRTGEADYIRLMPSDRCSSPVGRKGDDQIIRLMDPFQNDGTGCYFQQIIHEIAHSAGVYHEQSREDRDNFVTIVAANIEPGQAHNFNKQVSNATDVGPYDFESIMHYGAFDFSSNGMATIVSVGGQTFGEADEYSTGDVATLNSMYPNKHCPDTETLDANWPNVSNFSPLVRPMHYEAATNLGSTSVIQSSSNVTYDAGESVRLLPGFQAEIGSDFRAVIDGCDGAIQSKGAVEAREWATQGTVQHPDQSVVPMTGLSMVVAPNPFFEYTTIAYQLEADQVVNLQVVDIMGRPVAHPIVNQLQVKGAYKQVFMAGDLPPGLYRVDLRVGNRHITQQMAVLR